MNFSVSQKVFSITLAAALTLAVILAVAFREFAEIRRSNDRVLLLATALQTQQYADMMHDALRGDAIAAPFAAERGDTNSLREIENDYVEHSKAIHAKMQENQKLDLTPEIQAAIAKISGPLDRYTEIVGRSVTLSRTDYKAASDNFIPLQKSFHELEEEMGQLSELIEKSA